MRLATLAALTLFIAHYAFSFGNPPVKPVSPVKNPSAEVEPVKTPPAPKELVKLDATGPLLNPLLAIQAVDLLNEIYDNGCLEREMKRWSIPITENVFGKVYKSQEEAYARFMAKAPYGLELRVYKAASTIVGYTYNYYRNADGSYDRKQSEYRIWSNLKYLSTAKRYSAHIAHELSHQSRAGAFGHYDKFQGSFPYEIGDIAYYCVSKL